MEYNEAEERHLLEAGEIGVDDLQRHADKLEEKLRSRRRVMTAGRPTGPPKEVAAWGRTTGTAVSGVRGAEPAGGSRRGVFGTGCRPFSMVPWFVATALYTHPTWQGTAAISLPS